MAQVVSVNVHEVKKVLDGRIECLGSSFMWAHTPEGEEYWRLRAQRKVDLSVDDLSKLLKMVEDFQRWFDSRNMISVKKVLEG